MTHIVGLVLGASLIAVEGAGSLQQPPPPNNSPPVLRFLELRFPTQGNQPFEEPQTYLRQIDLVQHLTMPGQPEWSLYADVKEVAVADAERLWRTGQFDSLWIDVAERPFENGVAGILVAFNFVERPDPLVPSPETLPVPPAAFAQPPSGASRLYPPPR